MKTKIPHLILAGLFATATALPAAMTIITGVTVEGFDSERSNRQVEDTINGNGFDEVNGYHENGNGDNVMYHQDINNTLPNFVIYDLEANYDLASLKVWNYNDAVNLGIGAKDVTISVASSDGATYPGAFTDIWTGQFDQAPGSATVDFGQVIDLNTADVRLVRFDITSNYGFTAAGGLTGFSEVRFTAAPEPSSTALLGLGGLALMLRRKRS
mgnify:CR=1 FL=1